VWASDAPQAIGFARLNPFQAPRSQEWDRKYAAYYGSLWSRLLNLLVMPDQLTAQAEELLGKRPIPDDWPQRGAIIDHLAWRNGIAPPDARRNFLAELATRSKVFPTLVNERVRPECQHGIRTLADYRRLSDDLIRSSRDLQNWRLRVADELGVFDAGDLALWLMEPYARLDR
jgi:hypothetical protein